jgi:hypothetical protein
MSLASFGTECVLARNPRAGGVRDSAPSIRSSQQQNARPDSRRADARSVPPADTGRPTGPGSSSSRKTITTRRIPSTATTPPASTVPSSTPGASRPPSVRPRPRAFCARAFPIPPSPAAASPARSSSLSPPSASRRRFLPLSDRHTVPSAREPGSRDGAGFRELPPHAQPAQEQQV